MDDDMNWGAYIENTRSKYVFRYANFAKQNAENFSDLREEFENIINAAEQAWYQKSYGAVVEMANWLWSSGGQFLDLDGHFEEAVQLLTHTVDSSRMLGDKKMEGDSLGQLGRAWKAASNLEKAREAFEQALMIAREIPDRLGEANHLGNIGLIHLEQKNLQKAEDAFQEAIEITKETQERQVEGRLWASRGLVKLGENTWYSIHEAIEYFERAIQIAKETGDHRGEASHLGSLGSAYEQMGRNSLSLPPEVAQSYLTQGPYPADNDDRLARFRQEVEQANQKMYWKAYRYYNKALTVAIKLNDRTMQEQQRANLIRAGRLGKLPIYHDGSILPNILYRNQALLALFEDD